MNAMRLFCFVLVVQQRGITAVFGSVLRICVKHLNFAPFALQDALLHFL
jgi:hypothetical protein